LARRVGGGPDSGGVFGPDGERAAERPAFSVDLCQDLDEHGEKQATAGDEVGGLGAVSLGEPLPGSEHGEHSGNEQSQRTGDDVQNAPSRQQIPTVLV